MPVGQFQYAMTDINSIAIRGQKCRESIGSSEKSIGSAELAERPGLLSAAGSRPACCGQAGNSELIRVFYTIETRGLEQAEMYADRLCPERDKEALFRPRAYTSKYHRKAPRRVNRCIDRVDADYQWQAYPGTRCRQATDKRAACPGA